MWLDNDDVAPLGNVLVALIDTPPPAHIRRVARAVTMQREHERPAASGVVVGWQIGTAKLRRPVGLVQVGKAHEPSRVDRPPVTPCPLLQLLVLQERLVNEQPTVIGHVIEIASQLFLHQGREHAQRAAPHISGC